MNFPPSISGTLPVSRERLEITDTVLRIGQDTDVSRCVFANGKQKLTPFLLVGLGGGGGGGGGGV